MFADYTEVIVIVIVAKKEIMKERINYIKVIGLFSGNIEHSTRIDKLNEKNIYNNNNKNKQTKKRNQFLLDIRAPCHICYKEKEMRIHIHVSN